MASNAVRSKRTGCRRTGGTKSSQRASHRDSLIYPTSPLRANPRRSSLSAARRAARSLGRRVPSLDAALDPVAFCHTGPANVAADPALDTWDTLDRCNEGEVVPKEEFQPIRSQRRHVVRFESVVRTKNRLADSFKERPVIAGGSVRLFQKHRRKYADQIHKRNDARLFDTGGVVVLPRAPLIEQANRLFVSEEP